MLRGELLDLPTVVVSPDRIWGSTLASRRYGLVGEQRTKVVGGEVVNREGSNPERVVFSPSRWII